MVKGRSTLVLLSGILVLGAFIWVQAIWRAKVPSKELRQVRLFDLDLDTLVSLQFQYTNLVVNCVKENGVWMTGGTERGLGRADVALVNRLVDKGVVSFRQEGRRHLYFPSFSEDECVAAESDSFIQRLFDGAINPMLAHLFQNRKLSKKEIEELKKMVDEL